MSRKETYWPFEGGLDVVTSAIRVPDGRMVAGNNFEPWINGGYRRIKGYERADGRPAPSDATWTELCLSPAPSVSPDAPPLPPGYDGESQFVEFILPLNGAATTASPYPHTTTLASLRTWSVAAGSGTCDVVANAEGVFGGFAITGTTEGDKWHGTYTPNIEVADVQDYTLEFHMKLAANRSGLIEIATSNASATESVWNWDFSGGHLQADIGGDSVTYVHAGTILSTLVHCTVERYNTDMRIYIDGSVVATNSVTATPFDLQYIRPGRGWPGAWRGLDGIMSNIRFSTIAKYKGNTFTPPVAAYQDTQMDYIPSSLPSLAVTGGTSGATGVIVDSDATTGCVAVTDVQGTFVDGEVLNSEFTVTEPPVSEGAPDIALEAAWRQASEEYYRTPITQVPGSGPVRGVWRIRDRLYAFRDNPGATACIPHKATATGWDDTAITFGTYVRFDAGVIAAAVGDTLTGATSLASGTIHKVIVLGGSYGTTDAYGYYVLTGVSGAYQDGENLQVSAVTQSVADGASQLFELPAGGRYSFVSHNFYAGADTYRVYAANGVGPAFEIDENDVITPILFDLTAGDTPQENKPYLVEAFNGRLWMALPGGSVQQSIVGDPLVWNGFLGAAEFGLGDEVTALLAVTGDVLVAGTIREWHGFYPNRDAQSTYTKRVISDRAGAILYSADKLATLYAVDDSGVIDMARVERFGDFQAATVSDLIQPIVVGNKGRIAGSMAVRETNQYRILLENGDGIIGRMRPDGLAEWATFSYGTNIFCAYSCEDENSSPRYYFGGTSGYVYEAERGRNFDGDPIPAFMRLPFNHQGRPAWRKRYRLLELELEAERALTLQAAQEVSYSGIETGSHSWTDTVVGGGGFYDQDNWDEIYWDSQVINTARYELLGTGKNISLLFYHEDAVTAPFILQGGILHFDERRVMR